jgi:hypothetical protein
MATKLTALTSATLPLAGTEVLYVVQGGNSRKTTAAALDGSTLLGTILTTSGSSQSLTSLDLTPYKFLRLVFEAVSTDNASWVLRVDGIQISGTFAAANLLRGAMEIQLSNGVFWASLASAATNASAVATAYCGDTDITTATTTVTVSTSAGAFDLGNVRVYGIR